MGVSGRQGCWKVILMGLLEGGGRVGYEGSGKQRKLARFERLAENLSKWCFCAILDHCKGNRRRTLAFY